MRQWVGSGTVYIVCDYKGCTPGHLPLIPRVFCFSPKRDLYTCFLLREDIDQLLTDVGDGKTDGGARSRWGSFSFKRKTEM